MKIALFGLGLVALAIIVIGVLGSYLFSRRAADIAARLQDSVRPTDVSAQLPQKVRDFALRADASPGDLATSVAFTQTAELQLKPGQNWQPVQAIQTVSIGAPGFLWQACQSLGPLSKFQVIDAYIGGTGQLRVRLLGLVRIVNATGPDIDRAEALRYLAELPWAPDAILGNPAIIWRMVDDTVAEAALDVAGQRAAVRFRFNAAGDIVEVHAPSRPTTDDQGNAVDLPWQGYFRDYRMIGPRRIPFEAEVGYIHRGGYRAYFQGCITDYFVAH